MQYVFHYAPGNYLPSMIGSGVVRPSNADDPQTVPAVWFSADQRWEPTATKMINTPSGLHKLSLYEQQRHYGCVRFALPAGDARLMDWKAASRVIGFSRDVRRAMEGAGRRLGASPLNWFAALCAFSLDELCFQVLCADGRWHGSTPQSTLEAWRASSAFAWATTGEAVRV
jgi:hypothetical protein